MTSKQNRRQFHFNVYEDNLKNFLDEMTTNEKFSDWARQVFDDLRTGKLSYNQETTISAELEYKLLRNKNYVKKNLHLDIKNRISLVHELKYSPMEAAEIASGKKSIDEEENRVVCFECDWKLDYKPNDISVEVDHLVRHIREEHNRSPTDQEQKQLLELTN